MSFISPQPCTSPEGNLDCLTDSVTVCQGTVPWIISGTVAVSGIEFPPITVSLDCDTDSVTVCQGTSPWVVDGTVELGATSLAALETITVNQGTSPWVIGDGGSSITVDAVDFDIRNLDCLTDSVTICPGLDPIPVTFNGTISVALDCATDSVTICPGLDPIVVTGTVSVNEPVTVDAVDFDIRNLDCSTDSVTICPGADPIPVTFDGTISVVLDCATDSVTICPPVSGTFDVEVLNTVAVSGTVSITEPVTVDAVDFDIRNLDCAIDSVTVCPGLDPIVVNQGTSPWVVLGTVALDAGTLAALETITVLQGTSPWTVSGTVTAVTNFDYAEDSPHVSGNPGAFVLAVRNDAGTPLAADGDYIPFTTDATGALRVNASFSGDISVSLDCATDSVTICPGLEPIVVEGTVELGSTTLAALETITVNQGTSPWVVGGTVAVSNFPATVAVTQNTSPWVVSATDLDIRNLNCLTDSVAICGVVDVGTVTIEDVNGTLTNGAETAVSSTAVQVLAANSVRKKYIIQNTGIANIRVGVSGVTATTGARLLPNGTLLFEMPNCPTQAIFAIREGSVDSIAFAQEIT